MKSERRTFASDLRDALRAQLDPLGHRREAIFEALDREHRQTLGRYLEALESDVFEALGTPRRVALLTELAAGLGERPEHLRGALAVALAPGRLRDALVRAEQREHPGPQTARRALLAVLQRTSARNVAARCGVSPQAVSQWASGRTRPSPEARARLETHFAIPASLWDGELGTPSLPSLAELAEDLAGRGMRAADLLAAVLRVAELEPRTAAPVRRELEMLLGLRLVEEVGE